MITCVITQACNLRQHATIAHIVMASCHARPAKYDRSWLHPVPTDALRHSAATCCCMPALLIVGTLRNNVGSSLPFTSVLSCFHELGAVGRDLLKTFLPLLNLLLTQNTLPAPVGALVDEGLSPSLQENTTERSRGVRIFLHRFERAKLDSLLKVLIRDVNLEILGEPSHLSLQIFQHVGVVDESDVREILEVPVRLDAMQAVPEGISLSLHVFW
mmetsp:Transcript_24779/g.46300  ORF Transcript_24779/g.46300 Transcript_24779/m.46300 type:complete len:215 (-) Transcript_24779:614-1258(-)